MPVQEGTTSLYVSLDEAASLLGVNKRQVTRMIQSGKLRAKDINASTGKRHLYRVLRKDIENPDKSE